jgi:hypothetical protein
MGVEDATCVDVEVALDRDIAFVVDDALLDVATVDVATAAWAARENGGDTMKRSAMAPAITLAKTTKTIRVMRVTTDIEVNARNGISEQYFRLH